MKFIHLADLHIGKHIANYSLLEDQRYILEQIMKIAKSFQPDCWFICGDIFDRSMPAEDSVELYDWFISTCAEIAPVFMIAGNHDSGKRLELFCNSLKKADINIVGTYKGEIEKVKFKTQDDVINVYMLPYFHPSEVRYIKEEKVTSYQEAFDLIIDDLTLDSNAINILLSHQFYTSGKKSQDPMELGNLDEINIEKLKKFDYVALGHLHNRQKLGDGNIRYCGTPLKFTLNDRTKYLSLITLSKDDIEVEEVELKPLHDVYLIEDYFENLITRDKICEDYVVINLLNKKQIPNIKAALLNKFPNLVQIRFNMENEVYIEDIDSSEVLKQKPIELLSEFFKRYDQELSDQEIDLAQEIFEKLEREEISEAITA